MGKDGKERVQEPGSKADRIGCLIVLIPLLLLLTSPLTVWWWLDPPEWKVLLVDKTVPHEDYREHAGVVWTLNHAKVKPPHEDRDHWSVVEDYIGYYPHRQDDEGHAYGEELSRDHLEGMNLLYLADGYGVYTADYKSEDAPRTALDYSKEIYGGYSYAEAVVVHEFIQSGGAVIGEFNTFADPTEGAARTLLEDIFGARWTGWAGRYFTDLANRDEVPRWARRHWKKHYGYEWDFIGPGFLFAHADTRVFVLELDKDVGHRGFRIVDLEDRDPIMEGVYGNVPFRFWFDIVQPTVQAEVLASYHLHVTPRGRNILGEFGLSNTFPAVVRASRDPIRLYFCGDFADNDMDRGPHFLAGWAGFRRWGRFAERLENQSAFFWEFYVPLMMNVYRSLDPPKVRASTTPPVDPAAGEAPDAAAAAAPPAGG